MHVLGGYLAHKDRTGPFSIAGYVGKVSGGFCWGLTKGQSPRKFDAALCSLCSCPIACRLLLPLPGALLPLLTFFSVVVEA